MFELSREAKRIGELERDMERLAGLLGMPVFRRLVESPLYTRADQGRAVMAVAAKAKLGKTVSGALGLMARRRRLFTLPHFVRGVRSLISEHKGEVVAEVTSAVALTPGQKASLSKSLRKAAGGREVKVDLSIDESLMGGLVVKLGSRMIDTSIRSQLSQMENAMKEVS